MPPAKDDIDTLISNRRLIVAALRRCLAFSRAPLIVTENCQGGPSISIDAGERQGKLLPPLRIIIIITVTSLLRSRRVHNYREYNLQVKI